MTVRHAVLPLLGTAALALTLAGCGSTAPVAATLLAAHPSATLSQSEKTEIIRGIEQFVTDSHDIGRAATDAVNEGTMLTRLATHHQATPLAGELRGAGAAWASLAKAIRSNKSSAIVTAVSRAQAADDKLALVPATSNGSGSGGASSRQTADAAAEELAHTAQVAIETYATDHAGSYAGATPAVLHGYESFIQVGPGGGKAYVAADGVKASATGYTVTATASNGSDRFWITRASNGTLSRGCSPRGQGNCPASGAW